MPGDLARLDKMRQILRTVAGARERLTKVLAEEAMTQVRLGFRESRDPYGTPWAPLAMRAGGKPLDDTGTHLKGRITVLAQRETFFRIGTNFIGARLHQKGGTVRPKRAKALRFTGYNARGRRDGKNVIFARKAVIPARPYLPTQRGLGPIWGPAFQAAARRFMSRILKG